jgi:hypothetical protein
MNRYAILLASGLCLALWACAQPVPPPPSPGRPGPVQTVMSVPCPANPAWPTPGDLLTHVHYTVFTPTFPFTQTPAPDMTTSIEPDILTDLKAAFVANPYFSQNKLCGLDGIFINRAQCTSYDPSSCSTMKDTDVADNSWGFRTPLNQKYVALSLGLWRGNPCPVASGQYICAPLFATYHARLVKALLDRTANVPSPSYYPPTFQTSTNTNTSGISVLAAIAHETGHIDWFETFVQPPGSTPLNLAALAGGFCSGAIYPGGYWQGKPVGMPTNRFVTFGELSQNSTVEVANLPTLLAGSDPRPAGEVVDGIYHSGQYPSLLAAYSPDENFVEAFELSVLRNGTLSDLTVNVTGYSAHQEPILANGMATAPAVEAELRCFDSLSQPPRR